MIATETANQSLSRRATLPICVVDDDAALVRVTTLRLKQAGFKVFGTSDPEEALRGIRAGTYRVVLVDIKMPKMPGLEFLERSLAIDPAVQVILVTGFYSIDSATAAIKRGASDYLCKPLDHTRLLTTLDEFAAVYTDRIEAHRLDEQVLLNSDFHGVIGKSPVMFEVFDLVRKVAKHYNNALISGPAGAGKEKLARVLHQLSPSGEKDFQVCVCSTLSDSSFDPSDDDRQAGGHGEYGSAGNWPLSPDFKGTLFLDEVSELPMSLQAKLLRHIQSAEQQHGENANQAPERLRMIAATSHDLRAEVAAGKFREDLYYRLSSVEIRAPGLSERAVDIPLLVQYFVNKTNSTYNTSFRGVTRRAQLALLQYSWPGNVRELESVIAGAMMIGSGQFVDVGDLPKHIQNPNRSIASSAEWKPMSLAEMQRVHVDQVVALAGTLSRASQI
ncbi:MAG TPA: sigma-54 dependent transcriptional regulator, partial [Candidatus Acidoferrales bacterium]